jgi:hypothetical protein
MIRFFASEQSLFFEFPDIPTAPFYRAAQEGSGALSNSSHSRGGYRLIKLDCINLISNQEILGTF